MRRYLYFLSVVLFLPAGAFAVAGSSAGSLTVTIPEVPQDSAGKQLLYNGKVWRNLYQHIDGTQFLLSDDFLPGSVVMNGRKFNSPGIKLKLDLINDELLLLSDRGATLRLNNQMVEQFTLEYDNKLMQFINLEADSLSELTGYVNVIHNGKTALYVKYKKEIRLRDAPGDKDTFTQSHKIYLMKEGKTFQVNNRKILIRLLDDHKEQVRDFIRTNRIRISRNRPESFAPVLAYYDNLK